MISLVPVATDPHYHRTVLRDAIPQLKHAVNGLMDACAEGNLL
jgi:hypothetical protein